MFTKRLSDFWYDNHNEKLHGVDDPNWVTLRDYHKELEDKYLPKVLTCYIDPFNVVDMEEFKRGVRTALWDCDMCHYNIRENSDIDVEYDEDYYFAIITLKRGKYAAIRRFHAWVFSGAIYNIQGDVTDGTIVEVRDAKGEFLALGHYQKGSIAVRLFSF